MINGVIIKKLKVIPDERGRLMEIMRADDDFFENFGQVYLTTAYPGVVKGWHYHKKQADNMAVIKGMMKIVLYDGRKQSKTYGEINEIFAGVHNPVLVHIPALIYHGFKCISEEEALVVNIPTEVYHYKKPDEYRLPAHGSRIKYDWKRKDG
jgi:dTDP-4-dehydrorhamnose 3,5-epimerase